MDARASITGYAKCYHSSIELSNATITILETGEKHKTNVEGLFGFQYPINRSMTLKIEKEGYRTILSSTYIVPKTGLHDISFQVPTHGICKLFSWTLWTWDNPDNCQIVGTVTALGKTLKDLPHGEPGVTVELWHHGKKVNKKAHYFGIVGSGYLKDKTDLFVWNHHCTTRDGGFIFTDVPPGNYDLHFKKNDNIFNGASVMAKAGLITNILPGTVRPDHETKETPAHKTTSTHCGFFSSRVVVSSAALGVLTLATCGVGTAAAAFVAALATSQTVESLYNRCSARRPG